MSLTEVQIRSAKAAEKPVKLSDGGGLFLLVNPNGSRWWRFRYRYGGKERGISLGVYPDVSLKLARARRNDARRMLVEGVDPSAHRQAGKLAQRVTLQLIAEEWILRSRGATTGLRLIRQHPLMSDLSRTRSRCSAHARHCARDPAT